MLEKNYNIRDEQISSSSTGNTSRGVSLELLQHVVMISPFGQVITAMHEKDQPIIFVNRSFEKITGYKASEVIGCSYHFLLGEGRDQDSLSRLQEAVQKGLQYTEVVRYYKKDGSLFYNELTVYPVFDDNGEITHYVWVLRDVTSLIEADNNKSIQLAEKDKRFSAYFRPFEV